MQDLSKPAGQFGSLVPSSQEGGNLVQENLAEMTMTAPGSEPVTPLPPPLNQSDPQPNRAHGVQDGPLHLPDLIPVHDTSQRITTEGSVPHSPGRWETTPSAKENLRAAAKQ